MAVRDILSAGVTNLSSTAGRLRVKLINAFDNPHNLMVAAARSCYSARPVFPEDVNRRNESRQTWSRIAESVIDAGHHTTLQHTQFQFLIEGVSRNLVWNFLHSHPYYNSEQVSQRYSEVSAGQIFIPPYLKPRAAKLFVETIKRQHTAYLEISNKLYPSARHNYFKIFPGRKIYPDDWQSIIQKKCQEAARYVLPLAVTAHLYHTISGLTLHRYQRISNAGELPYEQSLLISKMLDEVMKIDPLFIEHISEPQEIEKTPEWGIINNYRSKHKPPGYSSAKKFKEMFDESLGGKHSVLISAPGNSEKVLADTVRLYAGMNNDDISTGDALKCLLSPKKNTWLSDRYNMTSLSKISQGLQMMFFVFRKKMSIAADSQNQRHRTTPGVKNCFMQAFTGEADIITPALISSHAESLDVYQGIQDYTVKQIEVLLNEGVSPEWVSYLFTNAGTVRMIEGGSLSAYHHKWRTRSCLNAQEEIWRISCEELDQVKEKFPLIGCQLGPPCSMRKQNNKKPYCPEGSRYCGIPVWKRGLNQIKRII